MQWQYTMSPTSCYVLPPSPRVLLVTRPVSFAYVSTVPACRCGLPFPQTGKCRRPVAAASAGGGGRNDHGLDNGDGRLEASWRGKCRVLNVKERSAHGRGTFSRAACSRRCA